MKQYRVDILATARRGEEFLLDSRGLTDPWSNASSDFCWELVREAEDLGFANVRAVIVEYEED